MIFIGVLFLVLILLGVWEYRKHQKTIRMVPQRVHVNGTRGKSSVTRLITGGLQGGGIITLGKTTGTKPCFLYPDGREVPIVRIGKANIIEQLKVTRRAVDFGVETLVVECMAVLPHNQLMAEKQIVHSTVGVITNARADHLDEMGPTVADVARSLSGTIPRNGILFTCEQTHLSIFQEVAKERNSQVRLVTSQFVTDAMMAGFTYLEHRDNVALALAVCGHLGVSEAEALDGMKKIVPDPGVLRIFNIHYFEKEIEFVNAFAANDPDSYIIIWQLLKPFLAKEKKTIVIVNCRKDRIQRTESLAELIAKRITADYFILVGELTTTLYNRALALGLPSSNILNLVDSTTEDVFQRVVSLSGSASIVIGIGNIVGFGEELVVNFTNRGKELAYRSS
jgi:poly-gamma-glutamate synthase PgsB/CapB